MSTKRKAKDRRAESLRRRTWGLRMAIWAALLLGTIGVIAFVLLSNGGGNSGGASRFPSIHMFDTADYHSLAFSPSEPGAVLYGHHNGLQLSRDGGQTWETVVDQDGWDAMNLAYDPFDPDTVYMAGHNVHYRSDDGGQTWDPMESNLPGRDLHAFAASRVEAGRLYAFAVGFGLLRSTDGGRDWQPLSADVPQGTNSILELPDGTLLIGAGDAGILRSEDGGKTWTPSRSGIETGVIFAVKGNPDGTRIYSGTNRGLFVSIDGGKTWSPTALDDTLILVIGVHPANPLEILVVNGEGQLYRSRDGGATWG